MALKRNERYPGRYSNPTTDHPQGAFKNRTAPSAQDGSYLEKDWTNDWDGFFGRLLTLAGITPNGNADTALVSQYYDALKALFLQRTNPFGDIKSDGTVNTALSNLGLGSGAPAIGVPFFWSSAAMPNTVLPEWSGMVFLKFNGATFSAVTYPKLALVFPALLLPEARGEFLRVWDDGRGVDAGRALLSAQLDALQNITGSFTCSDNNSVVGAIGGPSGAFTGVNDTGKVPTWTTGAVVGSRYAVANFNAANVARTSTETRSRNIAFNLLVRAK